MRVAAVVLSVELMVVAGAAAGDGAPTPAVLRLVWSDRAGKATAVRPAVLHELRAELRAAGVNLRTTIWDGHDRAADPDEIHVIVDDVPPPPLGRDTMGAVQTTPGRLRSVHVFVGVIERVLGLDVEGTATRPPSVARDLSRAIARVILHELVHEGAGATHQPDGLMAARLDRRLLAAPTLTLDADLRAALRSAATRSGDPAELPQAASR